MTTHVATDFFTLPTRRPSSTSVRTYIDQLKPQRRRWSPIRRDFRGASTLVVIDHRVERIQMTALVSVVPDLLTYEQLGPADSWRGQMIRLFFAIMRLWPISTRLKGLGE